MDAVVIHVEAVIHARVPDYRVQPLQWVHPDEGGGERAARHEALVGPHRDGGRAMKAEMPRAAVALACQAGHAERKTEPAASSQHLVDGSSFVVLVEVPQERGRTLSSSNPCFAQQGLSPDRVRSSHALPSRTPGPLMLSPPGHGNGPPKPPPEAERATQNPDGAKASYRLGEKHHRNSVHLLRDEGRHLHDPEDVQKGPARVIREPGKAPHMEAVRTGSSLGFVAPTRSADLVEVGWSPG
eukprot:8215338-Pyramimonas_sp.AAC.1